MLSDYGINDDFIRSLGETLEPGTSALFVLVRRATLDKVLPEVRPFGGKVIRTSLSTEQEARLRRAGGRGPHALIYRGEDYHRPRASQRGGPCRREP